MERFSKEVKQNLTRQIGVLGFKICPNLFAEYKDSVSLAETFPLYTLDVSQINLSDYSLADFVKKKGYYHQVVFGKDRKALAFAISKEETYGKLKVVTFAKSKLPAIVDEAISSFDNCEKGKQSELKVRFLEVPTFFLHTFWFLKENGTEKKSDSFFFIECDLYNRKIPMNEFLTEERFLSELKKLYSLSGVKETKK
jgi:hypothetical protein